MNIAHAIQHTSRPSQVSSAHHANSRTVARLRAAPLTTLPHRHIASAYYGGKHKSNCCLVCFKSSYDMGN